MAREKVVGIYKIENLVTGHVYIGRSIDVLLRIVDHKGHLKYNKHYNRHLQRSYNHHGIDNFTFDVICVLYLDEIPSEEHDTIVQQFEDEYIREIPDGKKYNQTVACGTKLGLKHSEETREKLRQYCGAKHSQSIDIALVDGENQIIKIYHSIADAAKEFGINQVRIVECCQGKYNYCKGLIFRYLDENMNVIIPTFKKSQTQHTSVIQMLDKETLEVIQEFESMAQAVKLSGISTHTIIKCCKNQNKISGGYKFRYKVQKQIYKVKQTDLNGNVIGIYESVSDAARKIGFTRENINRCCNGYQNTSGGYKFNFIK